MKGRIDHLAFDAKRKHLVVAEYGNGTLDDIDLSSGKVVGRISGLHEPQGVAWLSRQDEIAVASGDGRVTFYRSGDLKPVTSIKLGNDADDVRIDGRNGNLVVGYGSGALAVIDPTTHEVVRFVKLPAHPEGFVLLGAKVIVNVPDAEKIVIADLDTGLISSNTGTAPLFSNYAIAADPSGDRVAVSYRFPKMVSVLGASSQASIFTAGSCGDADDAYYHAKQIVIVCGSGAVDLIDAANGQRRTRTTTTPGARTGLLVPQLDRMFVALPSHSGPAEIWELSFR